MAKRTKRKKAVERNLVLLDAASLGTQLTATTFEEGAKWEGSVMLRVDHQGECCCKGNYLMVRREDAHRLGKMLLSLKENEWQRDIRLTNLAFKRRKK